MFKVGNPDGMPYNPLIKHKGMYAGNAIGSSFSISPLTYLQYSTESHNSASANSDK